MNEPALFMYGFLDTDKILQLDSTGIDHADVYSEPHEGICALVSRTPTHHLESLPRETVLRNLAIYQAVIERVMEKHQVLPVKYGTLLGDDQELHNVLVKGKNAILNQFGKMQNKQELDVVALWNDMEGILSQIGKTPEVTMLKDCAAMACPDEAAALRVAVGKEVKACLDEKSRQKATEVLDVLGTVSEDYVSHALMDDSMIMNAAFLLEKEKKQAFEKTVSQLDQRYEDSVLFRLIGPLPPYSFCTLEIHRPNIRQLQEAKEVLGLEEEASLLEIRESYWRLTKEYHPDRFPDDAEAQERFEVIVRAYRTLCQHCRDDRISFRKIHLRDWVLVRPMKRHAMAG